MKELQELFCYKITIEYEVYKKRIQKHSARWTLNHVYEIEMKARIYETLIEMSVVMQEDMLRILLVLPEVIHLFYRKWMKYKDSSQKEIRQCVCDAMQKISVKYIGQEMVQVTTEINHTAA